MKPSSKIKFYNVLYEFIGKLSEQYPIYSGELNIAKTAIGILRSNDSNKIPVNWCSVIFEHRTKIMNDDIAFFKESVKYIEDENLKLLFNKLKEISEISSPEVISSIFKYLKVLTILAEQLMKEESIKMKSYDELKKDIESSVDVVRNNIL